MVDCEMNSNEKDAENLPVVLSLHSVDSVFEFVVF